MSQRVEAGPLVAGGDSLVRRAGEKTMFVEGAIPGEVVDVEVTDERKDLMRARVVNVVEASPKRVKPPCRTFGQGCGGCQWQHIDIGAQHEFKIEIVRDCLRRIAKVTDVDITFGGAVSVSGYRTNMKVGVVDGHAALRRRNSNELVVLQECVIAHPLLEDQLLEKLLLDSSTLSEMSLRVSATDETAHDSTGTFYEEVAGRHFRISKDSFFQSGLEAAELLLKTVDAMVPNYIDWMVDAYAGVGLFAGVIGAKRDARVSAIESSRSSARDARHNLADIDAEVIESEVAGVLLAGSTAPDIVIADPPRTGLGRSAAKTLTCLGAPTFVLVSCDPASLARDVGLLADAGYLLQDVVVLDLFPHTHHVETVSRFTRPAV